jgi:hypothetical protein
VNVRVLRRKCEESLQRRVALLLVVGVINLPVQEALAAVRDARAMNPSPAPMVVAVNQGFGNTPSDGAHPDDCPCHCVFPCAALHSPLLPSLVQDLLPRMIASPKAGEVPAELLKSPTVEPAVRPPIA